MPDNQYPKRRPRKQPRYDRMILPGLLVICLIGIIAFVGYKMVKKDNVKTANSSKVVQSQKSGSAKKATSVKDKQQSSNLPKSKASDWNLVLVNRENPKDELNPELTQLGNIVVDSRIAQSAEAFLTAAQAINPAEHFISGYRSVAYQETLYNQYVAQEMAADPSLDHTAAEKVVQTYSQPAGMSEHQTGLAIDLSDVDSLNESTTAKEIAAIAPTYGFVLRFTEAGKPSTGVGYEDWHFRYVGVENAKYMTEHNLTLEQYLKQLS
ncbi:MAG: D-alanyl-D-alanine carboxypeptidase family protein [Lactococcus sp.]|uniref:Putative D-alanyl-D-alanine carboxypeptidase n=1 Tax=Pseudolactococcus piscium MKFS47 TaxID=297352 RepID=A0A0D6DX12_9LACT|nr:MULTISPECIES: D-alanyl-D-alanine carboxypeptidase family protein [Lactococcus]MCJ1971305.1 D-alanyl-D-alanine carboxypeptidase family protein [Lactococcus carnosus]MDN5402933.1 D-alanyl-D-alanine carboxypeptidase family protein [Lactococcus sp.]MDN5408841.1 D-alanyl-D-alanine carboxypeptidase family protein [Lactococcus sp.]MDN5412075.1 D-alanyl-D-alanine carboxypeptidase family protein [Lactococcus sp.]MDN5435995.1 D-alanyl-D-alanine carboxypeptidase family protein [Lactococcus sp.]